MTLFLRRLACVACLGAAHCGTPANPMSDGSTDAPDAPDQGPDVPNMCFSDFPCFGARFRCLGTDSYVAVVDHDCHYACGPGPCSGGSCDSTGSQMACPSGTVCVDWRIMPGTTTSDTRSSPCEVPDAGDASDASTDAADVTGG